MQISLFISVGGKFAYIHINEQYETVFKNILAVYLETYVLFYIKYSDGVIKYAAY